MCYSRTARIKKCPQAAPGYERPRQEVFVLSWLLIVWRLVACGAAGYRVPDMHHLRWTPRKAALVPKQSCFKCQQRFSRLKGPIRPLLVCKTTATGSSFGVRHEKFCWGRVSSQLKAPTKDHTGVPWPQHFQNVPNEGPVWNPFGRHISFLCRAGP